MNLFVRNLNYNVINVQRKEICSVCFVEKYCYVILNVIIVIVLHVLVVLSSKIVANVNINFKLIRIGFGMLFLSSKWRRIY
jgi:hypothetical protein